MRHRHRGQRGHVRAVGDQLLDGQRAADIGFVTLAVPRADLDREVAETAETLRSKDPHALRACKEAFKTITV